MQPVPVGALPKAWVCGRSPAEIAGSNSAGGHGGLSVVSVVCCQVEISATGGSLVQRSPTECGASECVTLICVPGYPEDIGSTFARNVY